MSFIDLTQVQHARGLDRYFPFDRGNKLEAALRELTTKYYIGAQSGELFEARGMVVTGESRVGKTRELNRLIKKFNEAEVIMPNGRPAVIVQCELSRKETWKDLGIATAKSLNYPIKQSRTQGYIWDKVAEQASRANVIGIHYDECQHAFTDNAKTNAIFLDNFKALLKNKAWPCMLILSGIPELRDYVQQEEQLRYLMGSVHFDTINPRRDAQELSDLCFAITEQGAVEFKHLATLDFFERASFGCAYRWGLVIELLILAVRKCKAAERSVLETTDFNLAYTEHFGVPETFTPFCLEDYHNGPDPGRLVQALDAKENAG